MEEIIAEFMSDGRVSATKLLPLIYTNQIQVLQNLRLVQARDKVYLRTNKIYISARKSKRRLAELCQALHSCGATNEAVRGSRGKIIPPLYEFCKKNRDENYPYTIRINNEVPNNRKRALFVYAKKYVRTVENEHKHCMPTCKIDNIL